MDERPAQSTARLADPRWAAEEQLHPLLEASRSGIALVRTRLWLALSAMAVIPLLVGVPAVEWGVQRLGAERYNLPLLTGVVGVIVVILAFFVRWLAREVLKPAMALEAAQNALTAMYQSARDAALQDALTRLGNHRAFHEHLEMHFRARSGPLCLVLLDLDDFKLINDGRGHSAGDDVLRRMGALLLHSIRSQDRAYRIGGDEFAIVLAGADTQAGVAAARRLLAAALEPAPSALNTFSFSAGVSSTATAESKEELIRQADAALYRTKRAGRTGVKAFDPVLDRDSPDLVALAGRVAAIARDLQLNPVYQPIVDLATSRVIGYEGLVRPLAGSEFANAGALFEAAEAAGKTFELDLACFQVIAARARALPDDCYVSVNASPRTIEAPEFHPRLLLDVLTRHGLPATRVVLELTEREPIRDLERLRRNLHACQAAGIRVAADDVGAGNAGLRLLSLVQFDIVKIDLSLVHEGAVIPASMAVLRSLHDMAAQWKAVVVAEGVETAAQLNLVRSIGINAAQGYLLGRPEPVEAFAPQTPSRRSERARPAVSVTA
ncbi:MAG TPA: bifunctional diguanylate cyclase/phosphodiesterase [Candidatus Limnocylindria bacterium]|nr:bifunctional diguanylate cyclase/phosphodiesterase [Candidatus Limnocylindria bacterium]